MASRARNRRKEPMVGRIIATLVIFGLLIGGGYFAYTTLWGSYGNAILELLGKEPTDYDGDGKGEAYITIYEGEIGNDVAISLEEAGVIKDAGVFFKMLLKKPDVEFMPGSYRLKLEMSSKSALEALQDPDNKIQFGAAIREGLTAEQTFAVLAAGTGIPEEKFVAAAETIKDFDLPKGVESLEGWLFPANYEFEPDVDAKKILLTLVDHQKSVLAELEVAPADQQRILTIASIIEKEAGALDDFPRVSAVIHNRLAADMKLEMDSTAQFGAGEHEDGSVWSSDEALASDNPWNTYFHLGLPIGPISNPGEAAIIAALEPTEADWLYFVVSPGGTGLSTFSDTIEEHEEAVYEYQIWCAETESSGC